MHRTAKVSQQVNRKCPSTKTILQLSTHNIDPIPSNSSPLEPQSLVLSGEYIKSTLTHLLLNLKFFVLV